MDITIDGLYRADLPGVSALYAKRRRVQPYCPEAKMETHYDETLIAGLAAAEKQVQQSYRPIIAVHKWFARRPGTLFRGLALAELDNRPLAEHFFEGHDLEGVCLDPFQGGGTAMFEANRLGLSVIGYDTNPMSRWLVERELEPLDRALFETEGECIAIAVEKKVGEFYKTRCTECEGEATVKSFLWVKTHICECGRETHLFAGPLVAGRGMKRHTHDVLVCGACLDVHQFLPDEDPADCPGCSTPYEQTGTPNSWVCECGREARIGRDAEEPPRHTLFALEYHCDRCKGLKERRGRFFKGADDDDHARFARARKCFEALNASPYWPDDPIPNGDESGRLLRWGYRRWRDLHNERQLLGLAALAEEIASAPEAVRPALATVYSDFIRYQNMVCRYDTAALKVLDVFSIHGFPVGRVQCEAALVGLPGVGSGGWRQFVAKYATAKAYCEAPYETKRSNGRKTRVPVPGERIAAEFVDDVTDIGRKRAALLVCGSLAAKSLPEGCADLCLTDPPYFANVQYSELMDYLYAWLRRLMPETPFFAAATSRSTDEVTGNTTNGHGIDTFAERLSGVYVAATLALKPGAPFVFTYHHNDPLSYAALVVAVLDAGLVPITTLACPSEMRGSIHINASKSSRVDSVFVLRKPPVQEAGDRNVPFTERLHEHVKHLIDAGLRVSIGDQRCIRFGLVAEEAMRALAPTWDSGEPIDSRMELARSTLTSLDEQEPAGELFEVDPPQEETAQLELVASR
jgi:putative DNA methylase